MQDDFILQYTAVSCEKWPCLDTGKAEVTFYRVWSSICQQALYAFICHCQLHSSLDSDRDGPKYEAQSLELGFQNPTFSELDYLCTLLAGSPLLLLVPRLPPQSVVTSLTSSSAVFFIPFTLTDTFLLSCYNCHWFFMVPTSPPPAVLVRVLVPWQGFHQLLRPCWHTNALYVRPALKLPHRLG